LIVDGEPQIRRFLRSGLPPLGYNCIEAINAAEALRLFQKEKPDAVILDLGLPDISGVEVIHGLRGWTSVPIIVLSARTAEAQKVAALDAGANDYVSKPFGMDELMARLRVALRAPDAADDVAVIETRDFTIDLAAKRVRSHDEDVRLTATEWQVVELLARNPGKLITQRQLLEQVWGLTDVNTNYVRVFMVAIRRKLEPDPAHPRYFLTEPGSGLRFVPEGADREGAQLPE